MIGKRIRKGRIPPRGSTKRLVEKIGALTVYVTDADPAALIEFTKSEALIGYAVDFDFTEDLGITPGEKVAFWGTRNLDSNELPEIQMMMAATAARAPASRDPIEHYVLSWTSGEHPDRDQVAKAVATFAQVMAVAECQIVWSLHTNTRNDHVHIVLNRIHPISGKPILAGEGWDKDRLHQATALIAANQGWSSEVGALFTSKNGMVFDAVSKKLVRDGVGQVAPGVRGVPGCIAGVPDKLTEACRQEIASARNWTELHDRVRSLGLTFDQKASGAEIGFPRIKAKASKVARECSMLSLEARLGAFEFDHARPMSGYEAYKRARRVELKRIRAARDAGRDAIQHSLEALAAVPGREEERPDTELRTDLRSEHVAARTALNRSYDTVIKAFEQSLLTYDEWLATGRSIVVPMTLLPTLLSATDVTAPVREATPLTGFEKLLRGTASEYYDYEGQLCMTDFRSLIIVHRPVDPTISAALTLASERWSKVRVSGSAEFVAACARVAAAQGIELLGPDGEVLVHRAMPTTPPPATSRSVAVSRVASINDVKPPPRVDQSEGASVSQPLPASKPTSGETRAPASPVQFTAKTTKPTVANPVTAENKENTDATVRTRLLAAVGCVRAEIYESGARHIAPGQTAKANAGLRDVSSLRVAQHITDAQLLLFHIERAGVEAGGGYGPGVRRPRTGARNAGTENVVPIARALEGTEGSPTAPDHRLDPARQTRIATLVEAIDRSVCLPMHRRPSHIPGNVGALELVVSDGFFEGDFSALRSVEMLDDDPDIQRALERNRAKMLDAVYTHLTQDPAKRAQAGIGAARGSPGSNPVLQHAAETASGDPDFERMLQRVETARQDQIAQQRETDDRRRRAISAAVNRASSRQGLSVDRLEAVEAALLQGDLWLDENGTELVIGSNPLSAQLVDEITGSSDGRESLKLIAEALQTSSEYRASLAMSDNATSRLQGLPLKLTVPGPVSRPEVETPVSTDLTAVEIAFSQGRKRGGR